MSPVLSDERLRELIANSEKCGKLQREMARLLDQIPGSSGDDMFFDGKTNHEWVAYLGREVLRLRGVPFRVEAGETDE